MTWPGRLPQQKQGLRGELMLAVCILYIFALSHIKGTWSSCTDTPMCCACSPLMQQNWRQHLQCSNSVVLNCRAACLERDVACAQLKAQVAAVAQEREALAAQRINADVLATLSEQVRTKQLVQTCFVLQDEHQKSSMLQVPSSYSIDKGLIVVPAVSTCPSWIHCSA